MRGCPSLVASAALAGCTAIPQPLHVYEGPGRPASELATIVADERVFIPCIDRSSLEREFRGYDNRARWPDRLLVAPGRHELAIVYDFPVGQRAVWAYVEFNAEAGRQYAARKEVSGDRVTLWIETTSGTIVALGVQPLPWPRRSALQPCP